MINEFLPLLITAAAILAVSAAIYFAIRYFAYKRTFPLPHLFDFLWIISTFLLLFISVFTQSPLEGSISQNIITWLTFITFLLIFYSLIFILDQFIVEYFLVSVLKLYIPPPLRKVIVLAIFALSVLVAVQNIFSINPWAIYAPTSLLSLGIGLALKDAFQTFFAGVALTRVIRIRDWIQFGDKEGEVIDINWARTVLLTWNGDHLFVPNSELQKGMFLNYSYKNRQHRCRIEVGASYQTPPQKVKAVLEQCASGVDGILKNPEPEAFLLNYGESSINYAVNFWVNDYAFHREKTSEVSARIWYAFKRENVEIPFPVRTVHLVQKQEQENDIEALTPLLSEIDLFKVVSPEDQKYIAQHLRAVSYLKGETVVRQGEEGSSFYLISKGSLQVLRKKKDGETTVLGALGPGNFFGELSLLTGEPRSATVLALEDSDLLRLEKKYFQEILNRHADLAENIAEIVASRQSVHAESNKEQTQDLKVVTEKKAISKKIRNFFNLK